METHTQREAESQVMMEAAAREARANAKEELVEVTSGAKEKVDRTLASAKAVAEKIAHPLDAEARARADEKAQRKKAEVSEKQRDLRNMAHEKAQYERIAARSQVAESLSQEDAAARVQTQMQPPRQP